MAQYPLEKRDEAKLLVVDIHNDYVEHTKFKFIYRYMKKGDIVILNNTKVIPARIIARKETGGKIEILFVEQIGKNKFTALVKGKNPEGKKLYVKEYTLKCFKEKGQYVFEIQNSDCKDFLDTVGLPPLPPYIKRTPDDVDRDYYQTVFAQKEGSIAAPTAGLHFTEKVLKKLENKGIKIKYINLKIGVGTFTPVKTKYINMHKMDEEYYEIPDNTISEIKKARKENKKIFVCGTTCVRAIESYALTGIKCGFTDLFIYPPFEFKFVDALITNFHLPKSTPLLLVCAFGGKEKILKLYELAKKTGYKFLSYGDAMLLFKNK